jgi:hypothetical protein
MPLIDFSSPIATKKLEEAKKKILQARRRHNRMLGLDNARAAI